MPYTTANPPSAVKGLPSHAIEIYVAAFNSALEQYKDEGKAAATAWAAVKTKYKKNEQGDWVAKEASVIDELKSKHSEIIQELGRRNASADAGRIKKIMELCQELLSSEPTEEKTTEALKESDSVLAWLREQPIVKTEDSVQFPAAAYAYVPDSQNPSTWRLRLWESVKSTKKQLDRASAYLSPGGFAGERINLTSIALSETKRRIRSEYRKLGIEEDMPRWVKEAELRTYLRESIEIPIEEVNRENLSKGVLPVRFLRPGFNEGKTRYYTEAALADACTVLDGMQMFANHQTEAEARERPEGDIRDWVAVLETKGVSQKGNAIGASLIHAPWFKEMVNGLYEQGTLNKLGVSINAIGKGVKGTIDGVETLVIEAITGGRSVDFVTLPGAGGVAGLREAIQLTEADNKLAEIDVDLISLATLREHRPDLVKEIETLTKNTLLKEVKKTMELEEENKTLKEANATLTTENETLKTEKETAEKAKLLAETKATVEAAVGKAELPEPAKARILERFKDAEKADGLEEAITAEQTYIAAISEAGRVKGLGGGSPEDDGDKALAKALREANPTWTEKQVEIAVRGR
jgi:cation transport regulator